MSLFHEQEQQLFSLTLCKNKYDDCLLLFLAGNLFDPGFELIS